MFFVGCGVSLEGGSDGSSACRAFCIPSRRTRYQFAAPGEMYASNPEHSWHQCHEATLSPCPVQVESTVQPRSSSHPASGYPCFQALGGKRPSILSWRSGVGCIPRPLTSLMFLQSTKSAMLLKSRLDLPTCSQWYNFE